MPIKNPKKSNDFELDWEALGIEPPEHNEHATDSDAAPMSEFITQTVGSHVHRWKARGNFLECDGGAHIHGMPYDHANQVFIGTGPDGKPLFQQVDIKDHSSK